MARTVGITREYVLEIGLFKMLMRCDRLEKKVVSQHRFIFQDGHISCDTSRKERNKEILIIHFIFHVNRKNFEK